MILFTTNARNFVYGLFWWCWKLDCVFCSFQMCIQFPKSFKWIKGALMCIEYPHKWRLRNIQNGFKTIEINFRCPDLCDRNFTSFLMIQLQVKDAIYRIACWIYGDFTEYVSLSKQLNIIRIDAQCALDVT